VTATLVAVAARSHAEGGAIRQSSVLHRRLAADPIALVLFQLAGEPFSATAIRYGRAPRDGGLIVCPDPRNRDLLFESLLLFARWLCQAFEGPGLTREPDGSRGEIATGVPQIVVGNKATVNALASLARRTAYLSTTGEWAADQALIAMGRHLQWATAHRLPGQQVLLSLTDLLAANWATPLSDFEAQSLPALDAWIAPPPGIDAPEAAAAAETLHMGPLAAAEADDALADLVGAFHAARRASDTADERSARGRIHAHWEALVGPAWDMLWRCLDRERALPEAPSVARRVLEDRRAYTRHMDWYGQGGRRRASQTVRQAVWLRHHWEEAQQRLEAEEAIDDPLRMVPHIVDGRALLGVVVRVEVDNFEAGPVNRVRRPLVVCRSVESVGMPVGSELYWTQAPSTRWTLAAAAPHPSGGSLVTLKRESGGRPRTSGVPFVPSVGDEVVFSELKPGGGPPFRMPSGDPWTHRPGSGASPPAGSIEEAD
jgi:hypothetical protein